MQAQIQGVLRCGWSTWHRASRALKAQIKKNAEGFEKMDEIGRLDQLEHRYKDLENRMQELNREGPGFRHEMKNELGETVLRSIGRNR